MGQYRLLERFADNISRGKGPNSYKQMPGAPLSEDWALQ